MGHLPPLVEPGPELSLERLIRYSRQLALPGFDETAQRRLAAARILVIGAGGLGSASIPYLASSGVGTIGVVDDDVVELSNLHRQVMHTLAMLGRPKVESAALAALAIDPEIRVETHPVRVDATSLAAILGDYDLVLDGSDNFETRYLCADACAAAGKPLVWGAILRFAGQVSVSWAGAGPTYRDLYPVQPAAGEVPNCAQAGVVPGVCAVIGSLMATEALKIVTGLGEPLVGRVTTYDALTGRFREIEYAAADDEPTVPGTGGRDAEDARPARAAAAGTVAVGAAPAPAVPATPVGGATRPRGRASHPGAAAATPGRQAASFNPARAQISVRQMADWRQQGTTFQLVDVREPYEVRIAAIPGSEAIPLRSLGDELGRLRHDVPLVVHCHVGDRSFQAVRYLHAHGYPNAVNLVGGIDAYARQVDTTMARY
ncbi:MAG TPA: ThiF family adenylyltransferase [Microbacteriaceae bacterium]|nr:ThiF family adenylyltransferase [Microbacteriaceae bacterium]